MKVRLRKSRLHTVCESARCPNMAECFSRPAAAFMIMGHLCARGCRFCAVETGSPGVVDPREPEEVARAAHDLGLKYVVVTSVTRDDLADGGAGHFAEVIRAVGKRLPDSRVEVLTPDFQGKTASVRTVLEAGPDVFNHNVETAPRLYPAVRPRADYRRSLAVLAAASSLAGEDGSGVVVKSGMMVGLGEDKEEVIQVMMDLAEAGCEVLTIGQYLQPTRNSIKPERYWLPEEYDEMREWGERLGLTVFAGPLVRSSYMADRVFAKTTE